MGYLSVGAGASKGLQTTIENMLAEQEAERRRAESESGIADRATGRRLQTRSLDQTDRSLGFQGRTQDRLDTGADISNEAARVKMGALKRLMPSPAASGPIGADGGQSQLVPPSGSDGGIRDTNNPEGRALLQIAGLNPNEIHGSVQQPKVATPENLSPEESFYASKARELGLKDYHALSSDQMGKLRREWAQEGRILSPSQNSEPMLLVDDPDNPGTSRYEPRSTAKGMAGPKPAGQKDKIAAYHAGIDLVDQIEALGDKVGWKGVGPVEGRIGRIGHEYLGMGSSDEELLRNKLDQLKAQASFQEGGKQFTGTEKQLLDAFLAGVNQNPLAVKDRLKAFRESAHRSLQSLGADGGSTPQSSRPGATGAKPVGGPPAPAASDPYQEYLNRRKPGGGG